MNETQNPLHAVPAIIMAGGYGTRMRHLTRHTPKPMLPVAGRPALEHVLEHLERHGCRRAALSLHYLAHLITAHFRAVGHTGMDLDYHVTPVDRGTAGGVLGASRLIGGDTLLVLSGDVLSNIDLGELVRFHKARGGAFTMALTHVDDASQYGLVETDYRDRIVGFIEKPLMTPREGAWVNAGVYVMDREILGLIPEDGAYDFSRDLIPALQADGHALHAYRHHGYWYDIGTPESLGEADHFFARGPMELETVSAF